MFEGVIKTLTCAVVFNSHFHQIHHTTEAIFRGVLMKKLFYKKESPTKVFSCEFYSKIINTFFKEHFRVAASVTTEAIAQGRLIKKAVLKNWVIFNFFSLLFIYCWQIQ